MSFKVLSLLIFLSVRPLLAGVEQVGTTSASFLKMGSGARPVAMGEAYVGIADDASGIRYNPAGMAQSLRGELEATHTEWFQGVRYEELSGLLPQGDGGIFGLSLNYLSVPSLARTVQVANTPNPDQNYLTQGSFQPYALQAGLAYARPVIRNLLMGANLKVLSESIDTQQSLGVAADFGVFCRTEIPGLSAGLSVNNVGPALKLKDTAYDLPTVFRMGVGFSAFDDKLQLGLESDIPTDEALVLAWGAEYNVGGIFFPRVGWRYNDLFDPWSAGFGVRLDPWGLDISVVPFGELGTTYRGSLNWRFGKPGISLDTKMAFACTSGTAVSALLVPGLSAPDSVTAWGFYIYDNSRPSKVVYSRQGNGPADPQLDWDGHLQNGQPAPEGIYWAALSVRYPSGLRIHSAYTKLEVNNTLPVVALSLDPLSLNPQAAGEAFIPTSFKAALKAGGDISTWHLDILGPDGKLFRSLQGAGAPPESIVWDGKDDQGEALISAQIYAAQLGVKDGLGREASSGAAIPFKAVFR